MFVFWMIFIILLLVLAMDIIHTITKWKDMMAKKDWFDLSVRLRRFLMTRQHIFYGFKWTQQCGQWVPILIKNKDVYKEWPADKIRPRVSKRVTIDNDNAPKGFPSWDVMRPK